MLQSQVIEVADTFVGAAIRSASGFRFHAVHLKVEELDQSTWPSLDDLRAAVQHLFLTGRLRPVAAARGGVVQSAASSLLLASGNGARAWMG